MISYTRGKYVDWEENVRPTSGDDLTDEQIAENITDARYNRSGNGMIYNGDSKQMDFSPTKPKLMVTLLILI